MRRFTIATLLALTVMTGCAARAGKTVGTAAPVATLAELDNVRPAMQAVKVEQGSSTPCRTTAASSMRHRIPR